MAQKTGGPQRAAALVIDAIKTLFKNNGSTAKNITEYLTAAHNIPASVARRTTTTTLSRGVAFGAFTRNRLGLYQLTDFLGRTRRGKPKGRKLRSVYTTRRQTMSKKNKITKRRRKR